MARRCAACVVGLTVAFGISVAAAQGDGTGTQNVQVLKGVPRDRLYWAMGFISQSLGVTCDHCHVRAGNTLRFELDDKPAKATARRMIAMTAALNRQYFGGAQRVTCASCHNGRQTPRVFPPVADVDLLAERRASAAAPLPAAGEVLAKYEQAIGGPAALATLTTFVGRFTGVTAAGTTASGETIRKAPGKWHEITSTGENRASTWICDGRAAWIVGANGTEVVAGADLENVTFLADFWRTLRLTDRYSSATTTSRRPLNGHDVYVVDGKVKGSTVEEQLFFDVGTGLLLRRITLTPTPLGPEADQADFDDYRTVNGIKVAFVVRSANGNGTTMRTYTSIAFNVPIDDATFDAPQARGGAPRP